MDPSAQQRAIPLRHSFAELLSENPSRGAVNAFLAHCQRIAVAYLRRRGRLGRLRLDQFDLTEEDLALDCLADLFRRDATGAYVQLRAYAASVGWERLDAAGLEIAVRRLVFSVVNEGLFRRYRENDPAVGRFIRTLKLHIKQHDALTLVRERSTLMVTLRRDGASATARPQMPPEVLEAYLHDALDSRGHVPTALSALAELFDAHPAYAPKVSLSDLALSIRSVLVRRSAADPAVEPSTMDTVEGRDLQHIVGLHTEQALAEVQSGMRALYVEKRGVTPSLYGAYFQAIRDILAAQFLRDGNSEVSFRCALDRYVGGLSSKDYRQNHQAVLEYLINLTKRRLLQRLAPLF